MASTFTWLDYSEHERRKMLDVIELFGEKTTRDELGLGGVRDAFADQLFPGISTIQTRARYFLFVPWLYLSQEQKRTPSASVAIKARKAETDLILAIEQSEDKMGLVGARAKENVQRLPSSIYWQGLETWGLRQFPGSQDEYHRSLDLFYTRRQARRTSRQELAGESHPDPDLHNWHPGLPMAPDDFPKTASFVLLRYEAEYLRERILSHCPHSLLARLVRERTPVAEIDFAWDLAPAMPAELREQLEHGHNFSLVMHGAQLLYNLMLAELRDQADWIKHYRDWMADWWDAVAQRRQELLAWDQRRFWRIVYQGNPRVSTRARNFVEDWTRRVQNVPDLKTILTSPAARQAIEHREQQLKGGLARLHNLRARELWPGEAGAGQLDLRWTASRRILSDILAGLEGQDA